MTAKLTVIVGDRAKRQRIQAAFAALLLGCKHTFDVSGSDAAEQVMAARTEVYITALWKYGIETIEAAAVQCADDNAHDGWFPSTSQWGEACQDVMQAAWKRARAARDAEQLGDRPELTDAQRLANLERLVAMGKAVKVMR